MSLLPFGPGHGWTYRPRETVALASIRGLVARRGPERAGEILAALAAADLAPIVSDQIRAAEALLCDPDYAADFTPKRVTTAMRALSPAVLAEARELAAAKSLPAWRALTATLYRRAPKPRASPASRARPHQPYVPTRPALPPGERLGTSQRPPAGVRTFDALGKVVNPPPGLAAIAAVTKHIRANDLLDAVDRRTVVADAKLKSAFGRDSFPVSEVSELFAPHLAEAR